MTKKKTRKKGVRVKRQRFPLRELLQQHGWSQRKLARASGLNQNHVWGIYHGSVVPTWPVIQLILTTLGADMGDLAPQGGAA
jgi:transcriptional regulator with XRE-family HTH domain